LIIVQVEEVLVEARSRDIQLDDGDYFKIIIALCQNKMAAQAQVPYLISPPRQLCGVADPGSGAFFIPGSGQVFSLSRNPWENCWITNSGNLLFDKKSFSLPIQTLLFMGQRQA
jgi:hypothetical protein